MKINIDNQGLLQAENSILLSFSDSRIPKKLFSFNVIGRVLWYSSYSILDTPSKSTHTEVSECKQKTREKARKAMENFFLNSSRLRHRDETIFFVSVKATRKMCVCSIFR